MVDVGGGEEEGFEVGRCDVVAVRGMGDRCVWGEGESMVEGSDGCWREL